MALSFSCTITNSACDQRSASVHWTRTPRPLQKNRRDRIFKECALRFSLRPAPPWSGYQEHNHEYASRIFYRKSLYFLPQNSAFSSFNLLKINNKNSLAGGPGFEPGLSGSEPLVLPLNYPPVGPLFSNDDLICRLAQEKAFLGETCT